MYKIWNESSDVFDTNYFLLKLILIEFKKIFLDLEFI